MREETKETRRQIAGAALSVLGAALTVGGAVAGTRQGRIDERSAMETREHTALKKELGDIEHSVASLERYNPPSKAVTLPHDELVDRLENVAALQGQLVSLSQRARRVAPKLHPLAQKLLGRTNPYRDAFRAALHRTQGDR